MIIKILTELEKRVEDILTKREEKKEPEMKNTTNEI